MRGLLHPSLSFPLVTLKYEREDTLTNNKTTSGDEPDRPFNPYRVTRSDNARAVVAAVRTKLEATEHRTRRRRAADEERYAVTLDAVIANALHHRLTRDTGSVAIPRSNAILERASRYRPKAIGGALPRVVDQLAAAGFLLTTAGSWSGSARAGVRSTMKAGPALVRLARRYGVTFADLGRQRVEETIVLKGLRLASCDGGPTQEAPLLEYRDQDHPTAPALRLDMAKINAALAAAPIDFADDVLSRPRPVDVSDRRLRRVFTRGSFQSGGRLFGGFWQPLSKQERAEGLTIDQEQVVELDFSGMGPRLLYGVAGVIPHFHDPYTLPGIVGCRDGIKKVFGAELFREAGGRGSRLPQGTRKLFPAHLAYRDVLAALEQAHQPIAHLFGTDVGHRIQYQESTIIVDVLLRLGRAGIVGLPIHDAILVGRSHVEQASTIMEQVVIDHLGFTIPVRISGQT